MQTHIWEKLVIYKDWTIHGSNKILMIVTKYIVKTMIENHDKEILHNPTIVLFVVIYNSSRISLCIVCVSFVKNDCRNVEAI